MGADAVGHEQYWTICAVGGRAGRQCACGEESVVVVGGFGCVAGSRYVPLSLHFSLFTLLTDPLRPSTSFNCFSYKGMDYALKEQHTDRSQASA